jgi:hypothetical protein
MMEGCVGISLPNDLALAPLSPIHRLFFNGTMKSVLSLCPDLKLLT